MQRQASLIVQRPLSWYALAFAYFVGLLAHSYFLPSLLCFSLLTLVLLQEKKILLLSLSFLFSLFAFLYTYNSPQNTALAKDEHLPFNEVHAYSAHIDTVQSLPDKRLRLILSGITLIESEQETEKRAVVYINLENEEARKHFKISPLVGMKIRFNASFRPIFFPRNIGISDPSTYWHSMNVFYSAYLSPQKAEIELYGEPRFLAKVRQDIYNAFLALCVKGNEVSQSKALLIALIFGERFYIDTETFNLFAKASLVHSIALSGMHLFFAFLLAFVLVKGLVFFFPSLLEKCAEKILITLVSLPLALLYFWIGNAPLSLLRASLMLFYFSLFLFMYRKISLLDCLVLTAFSILLFMPDALVHLGFQFSVLSVLAIALFAPYFSLFRKRILYKHKAYEFPHKEPTKIRKLLLYALGLLYISFVIQIFLFPLQAFVFGIVSPYFILNLLWLPLLQLVVLPLNFLALFTLHFKELSTVFLESSSFLTNVFIHFLQVLNRNEMLNSIQAYRMDIWQSIGYFLLILSLIYREKLKSFLVFVFISLSLLFAHPLYKAYDNIQAVKEERIVVRVLSVGQGQSVLISHANKNFLIDAGGVYGNRFDPGRDTVAKVLSYRAFPRIDSAFITHFDLDHAKGFFHLIKHIKIETLYFSAMDNKKDMREEMLRLAHDKSIKLNALKAGHTVKLVENVLYAQILSPSLDAQFNKANFSNNTSLVIRLIHKNKGIALFCGDLEQEGIQYLLNKDIDLQAEVLVLPHHGSPSAYNEEFYRRVSASRVVASTSLYNRFSFPSQKIVDYFSLKNIKVENTATDQERMFIFTNKN